MGSEKYKVSRKYSTSLQNKAIRDIGRQAGVFLSIVENLVRSRNMPHKNKEVIYKTYYLPVLTYAAKIWMTNVIMKAESMGRMKFLRSRVCITMRDKIRNETVRDTQIHSKINLCYIE